MRRLTLDQTAFMRSATSRTAGEPTRITRHGAKKEVVERPNDEIMALVDELGGKRVH